MTRTLPSPIICLCALLSIAGLGLASAAVAAESYPIEVRSETLKGSPFQISVKDAEAFEDADGRLSLKLRYLAESLRSEPLSVQGFTLSIYSATGELKGTVSIARSALIAGTEPSEYTYTVGAAALADLELSDEVVVQTTTSTSARCVQPNESVCDSAEFLCSSWCNNPLGGGRDVRYMSCGDCTLIWDEELECWVEHCSFSCECNEAWWPDQRPAYVDWRTQQPPR